MALTYARRFLATLLAVAVTTTTAVLAPGTPAHADVSGSGSYDNSAIADYLLGFVGQWGGNVCRDSAKPGDSGGQCRAVVNCAVWKVSGHTQNTGGGSNYFAGFTNAGGVGLNDINSLRKGDIVQVGQGVHTFVIVGRVAGNTFDVVDSNHDYKETVLHYHRTFSLSDTTRAFRMGRVGPSARDYVGTIVQWSGDTKPQKTSWLVRPDGRRYWVPSIAEYNCWRQLSAGDKGPQSSSILDGIVPDSGQTTWCPAINGPSTKDTIRPGQSLRVDQSIWSMDGRYRLLFQGDRNLVLYGPGGAQWATNRYTGDFVILQGDCNFVGYNLWGTPKWASGTGGLGDGCGLVVQNDGNLVIYNRVARPVWDRYTGRLV